MIVLINPKRAENLGNVVRACSCFGIDKVTYTGQRIQSVSTKENRLPRELRLYKNVEVIHDDYFFKTLPKGVVPVAVELVKGAENLPDFIHPANAVYIFGPEDGSIPSGILKHCYRFVQIPMAHCANLAASTYIILYDRMVKTKLP